MPGLAAFAIALLADRLLEVEPWSAAAGLAVRRAPRLTATAQTLGRVVVPVALVALSIRSTIELWRDASEIL